MKPARIRIGRYGSVRRYDGDGKTIPDGGSRVHRARDVYFPASSSVCSPPFPTTFRRWGISNSDGSLGAGRVCYLEIGGDTLRLLHVSPTGHLASLRPGQVVPPSTRVGATMPGKFPGGSMSHLHLDGFPHFAPREERFDLLPWLGFEVLLSLGGYQLAQDAPPITSGEVTVLAVPLLEALPPRAAPVRVLS